eukprot:TRINITY_DN463_c0_g2_i2.p1 TRINITY_DN463_c0_g2~~TRINITY_DN463_c0_g2_i2.p1  ORF type:complete len:426 (-),score=108.48 TRINITY_DN463_c0_g2_i2:140-1417(-)
MRPPHIRAATLRSAPTPNLNSSTSSIPPRRVSRRISLKSPQSSGSTEDLDAPLKRVTSLKSAPTVLRRILKLGKSRRSCAKALGTTITLSSSSTNRLELASHIKIPLMQVNLILDIVKYPAQEYPTNEDAIANHMYNFLINFYQSPTFSKYANTPLYIFGESYAGHYIPAIAKEILVRNEDNTHALTIPLRGIGIGDGLTDPINQLSGNGLFAFAHGLIDDAQRQQVELLQAEAQALVREGRNADAQESFGEIMDIIVEGGGGVNVYNYRDFKGYDDLDELMDTFWNSEETRQRYGVLPQVSRFNPCNFEVYNALINDFMDTVAPRLQYVVERIPVLLYNGQDDIIINTPSAEAWIRNFDWKHRDEFNAAHFRAWNHNGEVVGVGKTVENLSFVVVNKAGHLVPYDQPDSSANLAWRFINQKYWN